MKNESAIIVPIGEVEPIVSALRLQYDGSARLGVPAHITLLCPFCPSPATKDIDILAEMFSGIEAFEFTFTEVRRFPRTAYLHPNDSESFVRIVEALVEKWPDHKPYNGAFSNVVPHLTVADDAENQVLDEVESSLLCHLPIRCIAAEAWLVLADDAGFWAKKAAFPLGRRTK